MATKNIVPRENLEGNLGTEQKRWSGAYVGNLDVSGNTKLTFANGQITDVATQAQAEAGTDNTAVMTPLKTKQLGDKNYLPLSGGRMSGGIIADYADFINGASPNGYINICGGDAYPRGANLTLYGEGHSNSNVFVLSCKGGSPALVGFPQGGLIWDDKKVATQGALSMPSNKYIEVAFPSFIADSTAGIMTNIF